MSVRAVTAMLHVHSVPRAIAFYEKLGFVVGNTHAPEGLAEPVWAWLESGNAHLMLARADEPVDAAQQAVLFYLYCPDVLSFRAQLADRGVEVGAVSYPFYAPKGEFRVTDPDGYVLMVSHT
jgi:uncharacterized glyoxalase superfamily protein PhnB